MPIAPARRWVSRHNRLPFGRGSQGPRPNAIGPTCANRPTRATAGRRKPSFILHADCADRPACPRGTKCRWCRWPRDARHRRRPIPGSVPPSDKGPVVRIGYTAPKNIPTAAEILKAGVPRVKVVAIVGASNVITDQEVLETVWQRNDILMRLEGQLREVKMKELYNQALRKTIERELILDEMYNRLKKANKMAIIDDIKEKSAESTDQRIRDLKKEYHLKTEEDFNTWLRVQALTLPVLRRQIERQAMSQEYVNSMLKEKGRRVGLAEIHDYYDKHPDEFKTADKVKWQRIFIGFGNPPNPQAAFVRFDAIRKRVAAGEDSRVSMQYDQGFAKRQKGLGPARSVARSSPWTSKRPCGRSSPAKSARRSKRRPGITS